MRFARTVTVVGCQVGGEENNVITGGVLPPPGRTVFEMKRWLETEGDDLRKWLLLEPRGKPTLCVNLVVPPCDKRADAGFIIMESTDYPPMSGSNTICTTTVLLETGMLKMVEPETRLVLENVSSYLTYTSSQMSEWAFLSAIVEEADCGILLDVNNIYVSSFNHGFDPNEFVDGVPHHRVVQIHLAGHTNYGDYIIDTHSDHVLDPVWDLYRRAIGHTGAVSTLIEWDEDIPPLATLLAEAEKARSIRAEVVASHG